MTVTAKGLSRRTILGTSGALVVGFSLAACKNERVTPVAKTDVDAPKSPMNAYLELGSDGIAHIFAPNPEIGQGVKTSLPMIVAEELDIGWENVRVHTAAVDQKYGFQFAGGSMSIASLWTPLREAGAKARSMLVSAAAAQWEVSAEDCRTEDGFVIMGKKKLSYGGLADAASKLEIPDAKDLTFKDKSDYKLLGRRITGVDNMAIVTGQPVFGIDQNIPNMHYASYTKCPRVGGTVKSANLDAIKALPGIVDAFVLDGLGGAEALRPGVAIVGTSTYAVFSAKQELDIKWDTAEAADLDWEAFLTAARLKAKKDGTSLSEHGDAAKAFKDADKTIETTYSYPFLPHAPLEPQNCTAHVDGNTVEIWAPTQMPTAGAGLIAKTFALDPVNITLHQIRSGGGFGRRLSNDYMAEAVAISKQSGLPVKVQWTREDDMANDFYRPGAVHGVKAAIDADGKLTGYKNHFITFGKDGKAHRPASYWANSMPEHMVENFSASQTIEDSKIPVGWWRAPISNGFAFVVNGLLNEVAVETGRDNLDVLLDMFGEDRDLPKGPLGIMNTGRAAAVTREAARRAGWGKDMPDGRALGIAFCWSHNGYVAEVADVEVFKDKSIKVHKVYIVSDVGPIVNLSGAENQCAGAIIDGLSTTMGLHIDFKNGEVQEDNFDGYPLMRIPNTPEIDVHFIESDVAPTGLGEPGLPPIAPAITNAIFAATGDRVRDLPLSKSGYSFSA